MTSKVFSADELEEGEIESEEDEVAGFDQASSLVCPDSDKNNRGQIDFEENSKIDENHQNVEGVHGKGLSLKRKLCQSPNSRRVWSRQEEVSANNWQRKCDANQENVDGDCWIDNENEALSPRLVLERSLQHSTSENFPQKIDQSAYGANIKCFQPQNESDSGYCPIGDEARNVYDWLGKLDKDTNSSPKSEPYLSPRRLETARPRSAGEVQYADESFTSNSTSTLERMKARKAKEGLFSAAKSRKSIMLSGNADISNAILVKSQNLFAKSNLPSGWFAKSQKNDLIKSCSRDVNNEKRNIDESNNVSSSVSINNDDEDNKNGAGSDDDDDNDEDDDDDNSLKILCVTSITDAAYTRNEQDTKTYFAEATDASLDLTSQQCVKENAESPNNNAAGRNSVSGDSFEQSSIADGESLSLKLGCCYSVSSGFTCNSCKFKTQDGLEFKSHISGHIHNPSKPYMSVCRSSSCLNLGKENEINGRVTMNCELVTSLFSAIQVKSKESIAQTLQAADSRPSSLSQFTYVMESATNKYYMCSRCKFKAPTLSNFKRHMWREIHGKKSECTHCSPDIKFDKFHHCLLLKTLVETLQEVGKVEFEHPLRSNRINSDVPIEAVPHGDQKVEKPMPKLTSIRGSCVSPVADVNADAPELWPMKSDCSFTAQRLKPYVRSGRKANNPVIQKQSYDTSGKHFYTCALLKCMGAAYVDKMSFYLHNVTQHQHAMFWPCAYCRKTFTSPTKLTHHLESLHVLGDTRMLRMYHCSDPYCSYACNTSVGFLSHLKECHGQIDSFSCIYCSTSFDDADKLMHHLSESLSKVIQCPNCRVVSLCRSKILLHMEQSHTNHAKKIVVMSHVLCMNKPVEHDTPFTCCACGLHDKNMVSFVRHLRQCEPQLEEVDDRPEEIIENASDESDEAQGELEDSTPMDSSDEEAPLVIDEDDDSNDRTIYNKREQVRLNCSKCCFSTHCAASMEAHSSVHDGKIIAANYKCSLCLFEVDEENVFRVHRTCHMTPGIERLMKCNCCSYGGSRVEWMDRHLSEMHPDHSNEYSVVLRKFHPAMCPWCDNHASNMYDHVHGSHPQNTDLYERDVFLSGSSCFLCPKCEASFQTREGWLDHVAARHPLGDKQSEKIVEFKCSRCAFSASCRSEVEIHSNANHEGIVNINAVMVNVDTSRLYTKSGLGVQCMKCNFFHELLEGMRVHLSDRHGIELIDEESLQGKLPPRESVVHTSRSRGGHDGSMTEKMEVEAGVNADDYVVQHNVLGRTYQCNICGYCTKKRFGIARHMLRHRRAEEATNGFRCPYCPWVSNRHTHVACHVRMLHKGKKVFALGPGGETRICSRDKFSSSPVKPTLSNEPLRHCPHCNFATRQKSNLLRHMQSHESPVHHQAPRTTVVPSMKDLYADESGILVMEEPVDLGTNVCQFLSLNNGYIQCSRCTFMSLNEQDVSDHFNRRHGDPSKFTGERLSQEVDNWMISHIMGYSKNLWLCRICHILKNKCSSLRIHMYTSHLKFAPYSCSYCVLLLSDIASAHEHVNSEHPGEVVSVSRRIFHGILPVPALPSVPDIKLESNDDESGNHSLDLTMHDGDSNSDHNHQSSPSHIGFVSPKEEPNEVLGDSNLSIDLEEVNGENQSEDGELVPGKGSKIFLCGHCNYSSRWNSKDVKLHCILLHKKIMPFHCFYCNYSHRQKLFVERHTKVIHPNKPFIEKNMLNVLKDKFSHETTGNTVTIWYERSQASKQMGERRNRKQAAPSRIIRDKDGETTIVTPTIGEVLAASESESSASMVDPDVDEDSSSPRTNDQIWMCKDCSYKNSNKNKIMLHYLAKHMHIKPYQCGYCEFSSHTRHSVLTHADMQHAGAVPKIDSHWKTHATVLLSKMVKVSKKVGLHQSSERKSSLNKALSTLQQRASLMQMKKLEPSFGQSVMPGISGYQTPLRPFSHTPQSSFQSMPHSPQIPHYPVHDHANAPEIIANLLRAPAQSSMLSSNLSNNSGSSIHFNDLQHGDSYVNETLISDSETKCPHCNYTNPNKRLLIKHVKHHYSFRPFGCSYCEFKAFYSARIKMHCTTVHPGFPFRYKVFEKPETPGSPVPIRGQALSTFDPTIRPDVLGKPTEQNRGRADSAKTEVAAPQTPTEQNIVHDDLALAYTCPKCEVTAPTGDMLARHMKMLHPDYGPYACDYCNHVECLKAKIVEHLRNNHSGHPERFTKSITRAESIKPPCASLLKKPTCSNKGQDDLQSYQCKLCTFNTHNQASIRHHVMVHLDYKPFVCSYCDYQSVKSFPILKHIRKMHAGCKQKYRIIKKPDLEKAIGERYFMKFVDSQRKTGAKSRELSKAGGNSADGFREYVLKAGVELGAHDPEWPNQLANCSSFNCVLCGYSTRIDAEIKKHLMVEIDYKPYACSNCSYRDVVPQGVDVHLEKEHGGEGLTITEIDDEMESQVEKNIEESKVAGSGGVQREVPRISTGDPVLDELNAEADQLRTLGEAPSSLTMMQELKKQYEHTRKGQMSIYGEAQVDDPVISRRESEATADVPEHIVNESLQSLKCGICGHVTALKKHMAHHLVRHGKRKLRCSICQLGVFFPNEIRKHFLTKHPGFKLDYKRESTVTIGRNGIRKIEEVDALDTMQRNRTGFQIDGIQIPEWVFSQTSDGLFNCRVCDYRNEKREPLKQHFIRHFSVRWKCAYCDCKMHLSYDLRKHIRSKHKTRAVRMVELKNGTVAIMNYLNSETLSQQISQFCCNSCPFTSDSSDLLLVHMREQHTEGADFLFKKPSVCEEDRDEDSLDADAKSENESGKSPSSQTSQPTLDPMIEDFPDPITDIKPSGFPLEERLLRNKHSATEEKPFACPHCTFRSYRSTHVRAHIDKHHSKCEEKDIIRRGKRFSTLLARSKNQTERVVNVWQPRVRIYRTKHVEELVGKRRSGRARGPYKSENKRRKVEDERLDGNANKDDISNNDDVNEDDEENKENGDNVDDEEEEDDDDDDDDVDDDVDDVDDDDVDGEAGVDDDADNDNIAEDGDCNDDENDEEDEDQEANYNDKFVDKLNNYDENEGANCVDEDEDEEDEHVDNGDEDDDDATEDEFDEDALLLSEKKRIDKSSEGMNSPIQLAEK